MSSLNKPSIFTSRESFHRRPTEPAGASTPTRAPRPGSPVRRQSTPEVIERSRIQAAAEAASLVPLPDDPHQLYDRDIVKASDRATSSAWKSAKNRDGHRRSASPGSVAKGRSASHSLIRTPPNEFPPRFPPHTRSTSDASKRTHDAYEGRGPTSEPSRKRLKVDPKRKPRHHIEAFPFPTADLPPDLQPPSPLFFSNSPRPRPTLPPRFSSSEAGARMLSRARMEDSHMKTVSLARGVVTTPAGNASVPPTSVPPSRISLERRLSARSSSPETASREGGHVLNSIGIIELLEHDERPTFIVDLGVRENYGPGPVHLAFVNLALRSYVGLEAAISGTMPEGTLSSPGSYLQFKSWLMGATVNGESLDVTLPSFVFANMSWSCSTLRKKLRVISGNFLATPVSARPSELRSSNPSSRSTESRARDTSSMAPPAAQEPSDYFGSAAPPLADASRGALNEPVPTVEGDIVGASPEDAIAHGSRVSPNAGLAGSLESLRSHSSHLLPSPDVLMISESPNDAPCFDWTRLPVSDSMPQHIQFARSVDWSATALGPIETWEDDLRQMCNLIMASPHPAAMYWGDDLIAIYNEAYVLLAGQKHPTLMGQSYSEAWKEIWNDVKDVFASARTTGEATMKDDDCLFIRRSNYLEEAYFTWSIIPMVGGDGTVKGLYNPAFEKTRRKIAERRMLTLREVGERTASAREIKAFWAQVLGAFEFNEYDSPFLLLYSVADENDSDTSSIHSSSASSTRQCFLEGKLGVPDGHPAAPTQIDLRSGVEGFGPVFRDVMRTDKPVLLEIGVPELPEILVQGLNWRGFGDPVKSVVVCPIHPTTGENILGFLVLGVNPRRPYDDDYSLFVQLLSRQLATSLASVVLFEEEIRRGQRAAKLAALDRIELSEKLAQRTQEVNESETKFARMAEFAPVGIIIAGRDGKITFANDNWYDISGVSRSESLADTWMDYVNPEDLTLVRRLWDDLTVRKKLVNSEFRFRAQWEDRKGNRGDTWVLFSGYPEKDDEGQLKSVFACFTNISQQKWAEGIQTRKMEEAVELKRQQENFIDITSHEMRNPLSAILQCSDEIAGSLTNFRQSNVRELPDEILMSCLDAAQTISLCSQHQKRIVDDILTLSKLDSQLLLVTPVDAQPLTVVQRALKMHEGELQAADIKMNFVVDQSYRDLALDWVRLDPSRVLQVLINLTTNAIKFTGSESDRTISVTISAAKGRPSERGDAPVKYFPTRRKGQDQNLMAGEDWGEGEKLYIHFAVRDTGRGLSPEEKKMLFMRFSQASPRTHVQYGGSGLGLFISRELTELQGGQIGVESEAGKGSTFAFFVVAKRSSAPLDSDGALGFKNTLGLEPRRDSSLATTFDKTGVMPEASTRLAANGVAAQLHVLLVEDNLINQRVLQKQLKNAGTEVHLANHGGEALEKLRQSTYWASPHAAANGKRLELGVVLMDQEMPVMDGLTCTRKIRELEKEGKLTGHVPIIAVTANARAEQVQIALDAGMDDVVSKPFRIRDLVPKILELMEKYPVPSD